MTETQKTFAEKLSEAMKEQGYTAYRLAKEIGTSANKIDWWKKGKHSPLTGDKDLKSVCEILNITL